MDIIENYVLYLFEKEDKSLEELNLFYKAREFYSNLSNEFYLDNAVIKNCEVLGEKFFYKYESVKINKDTLSKFMFKHYEYYMEDKLDNGYYLASLMDYLIGYIGDEDYNNALENIFNKLLHSKKDLKPCEKNFLVQYITYKRCKSLNIPIPKIYITETFLNSGEKIENVKELGQFYIGYGCLIGVSKYLFDKDINEIYEGYDISYLIKQMHTVFHEIEHYKQYCYVSKGILNPSSFALIKSTLFQDCLSTDDFNEYRTNYDHREIEVEANLNAWEQVGQLLDLYNVHERRDEINSCWRNYSKRDREKAYAWQKAKVSDKLIKVFIEDYNIVNLIKIVNNKPSILEQFPQLKLFFNYDGKIKSTIEFFELYTKLDLEKNGSEEDKKIKDIQLCCFEFINHLFINNDIENMDFSNTREDINITFFMLLARTLKLELDHIDTMLFNFDETRIEEFKFVLNKRINRVEKYYNVLLKNQDLIKKLEEYDKNNKDKCRNFKFYCNLESLTYYKNQTDNRINRCYRGYPEIKDGVKKNGK